jgi:dienelactone hydrolase
MRNLVASALALTALGVPALAHPASGDRTEASPATISAVDPQAFARSPLTLANGVRGEVFAFDSRNPSHFREWFKGDLGQHVRLSAQLFPGAGVRPAPLIVMVPGSANIGPHHLDQAALLTSEGFAVLLIDPLHGRSIRSTAVNQAQLSWAASVFDIVAAIEAVAENPLLDRGRIGLIGSSRGGFAVLTAMMPQVGSRFLPRGTAIVAGFAGYPWCGLQFWRPNLAEGAMLQIFSGDRDDWVSVQQCQDLTHALAQAGGAARMKLLHGAGHAFDRAGTPITRLADVPRTTRFPTIYMDDQGNFLDPASGEINEELTEADFIDQVIGGGFVDRGVTIGSESDQAKVYATEMLGFFRTALLARPGGKGEK